MPLYTKGHQDDSNPMSQQYRIAPPFSAESAWRFVGAMEQAWNSRDPDVITPVYTADIAWCDRGALLRGTAAVREFLHRKWRNELHHRSAMELWCHCNHRLSVRVTSEWQHARSGQWYRTQGLEIWECDDDGLVRERHATANDLAISASDRRIGVSP